MYRTAQVINVVKIVIRQITEKSVYLKNCMRIIPRYGSVSRILRLIRIPHSTYRAKLLRLILMILLKIDASACVGIQGKVLRSKIRYRLVNINYTLSACSKGCFLLRLRFGSTFGVFISKLRRSSSFKFASSCSS